MKLLTGILFQFSIVVCCLLAGCGSGENPVQPGEPVTCSTGFLCSLEPVAVTSGYSFSSISVGGEHTCAIEISGKAYCWGSNRNGQLGNGSAVVSSSTPVAVAGGRTFVKISSGSLHTCALTAQGGAFCWGNGDSGALGTGLPPDICGTAECSKIPIEVIGGYSFTSIESGFNHTCAVTAAKAAYCWGSNVHGELGAGSYFTGSSLPELVSGSHQFAAISAGLDFTCAIAADNTAWCWGSGANDVLGSLPAQFCPDGPSLICVAAPRAVETTATFTQVVAGDAHVCALNTQGYAYCWGDNGYGQIGVSGAPRGPVPLQVAVGTDLKLGQLSAAGEHSCAITVGFVPYCWGRNTSGELGAASQIITFPSPVAVAGNHTYMAIAAGGNALSSHTCALTQSGKAYCWGSREFGQLGDGR